MLKIIFCPIPSSAKRNSFCKRDFIFNKLSVEMKSSNFPTLRFIESIRGIVSLFLSSHRHVTFTHFPRAQYVFISSLALTSLVREPLQSPSLSVLFTFIFHFLGSCFLFLSFFLQGDGTHFPSSTLDFSFFLFNSPPPLLLPPLPHFFHFHNSCRWKLRGRCNIKYAVYPCLESSIYIYIYTFVRYNFSPVSNLLAFLFFNFFPFLFCFLFCFFFQSQLMAIDLWNETLEGDDDDNVIAAYWNPCSTVICPFHFDYDR